MSNLTTSANPTKRLTNEEFIDELMRFSQYGALTQVFVIEAIRYYAETVSRNPAPEEDLNALLSPVLWHKIAMDVSKAMRENYETPI